MIALLLALCVGSALAAEHRVVRVGDTVESLATESGLATEVDSIRRLNGLGPDEQPLVGAILVLPVPTADEVARILTVTGVVRVTEPGEPERVGEAWQAVAPGTVVCTDADSYTTIRLAADDACLDHDDITLLPETCMTVQATRSGSVSRTSHVYVSEGSVSVAENAVAPGEVAIETASGITVAERGGFRVTIEADAARTESLAGDVAVIGAGVEVPLGAGQGSRVVAGEAPSPPVDLLEAGRLVRPEDSRQLVVPTFEWTPVERALGYRIELATSPDFRELVRREDVPAPTWEPELLFLPFRQGSGLWWRVSSFDRAGFLGLPSDPGRLNFPSGVGP